MFSFNSAEHNITAVGIKYEDTKILKTINLSSDNDEMPIFPGCENISNKDEKYRCSSEKLNQFIFSHLKYPEKAKKNGVEGKCIAQFMINPNGKISEITIVKNIGDGCGEAVTEVLEAMNNEGIKWIPGKKDGKAVKVMYTLPIQFKL